MSFLRDTYAENIRQYDEEVTKLLKAKDMAEEDARIAKTEKKNLIQKISDLDDEISEISGDNLELRSELRRMQDELKNAAKKCKKFLTLNDKLKQSYFAAFRILNDAKASKKLAKEEVNKLKEKNNALSAEIDQLKADLQNCQTKIIKLENELEELQKRQRRRRNQNPWLLAGFVVGTILTAGPLAILLYVLLYSGVAVTVASFAVALGIIGLILLVSLGLHAIFRD